MKRKVVLYLHIGNKNTEVGLGVLPNYESILSYARTKLATTKKLCPQPIRSKVLDIHLTYTNGN